MLLFRGTLDKSHCNSWVKIKMWIHFMFKTIKQPWQRKNKQAVNPTPSLDKISEFYVIKIN